jgi:hypothetical protein
VERSLRSFDGVEDDRAERPVRVWFERIGPTFGWLGSYSPITTKGFYVLLMHLLPVLVSRALPLSLLGHFQVVSATTALLFVAPVVIGCLLSLMRTAYRHSARRR